MRLATPLLVVALAACATPAPTAEPPPSEPPRADGFAARFLPADSLRSIARLPAWPDSLARPPYDSLLTTWPYRALTPPREFELPSRAFGPRNEDGRCDEAVPMPVVPSPDSLRPVPMPRVEDDGPPPVPMPNLCGQAVR